MFSVSRNFAKRTIPLVRQNVQSIRKMSGHSAEESEKEVAKWIKMSIGMFGLTMLCTAYNVMVHDHDHPRTDLPYMRIRNKPYPWTECPDCNILDRDCWAACRGEAPKSEEHH